MSRRSETSDSESTVIDIRLKTAILQRVEKCWKAGAYSDEARAKFLGYLVNIGVARYEMKILPEELGGKEELEPWDGKIERRSGADRRDHELEPIGGKS